MFFNHDKLSNSAQDRIDIEDSLFITGQDMITSLNSNSDSLKDLAELLFCELSEERNAQHTTPYYKSKLFIATSALVVTGVSIAAKEYLSYKY